MSKVYKLENSKTNYSYPDIEDRDITIYIERENEIIRLTPKELSKILKILNIK